MLSKLRILVIDDNIDLTNIISLVLTGEGFAVKICNDVDEGLFCLLDWKPQILLLDVNINGRDGRDFCQQIKTERKDPVKVILMSGDESILDFIEDYGADDYLAKPFDSNVLIQKINLHLTEKV
jgi:DNA-binding response OmpR family regulator